jgi:hypothetical protein
VSEVSEEGGAFLSAMIRQLLDDPGLQVDLDALLRRFDADLADIDRTVRDIKAGLHDLLAIVVEGRPGAARRLARTRRLRGAGLRLARRVRLRPFR